MRKKPLPGILFGVVFLALSVIAAALLFFWDFQENEPAPATVEPTLADMGGFHSNPAATALNQNSENVIPATPCPFVFAQSDYPDITEQFAERLRSQGIIFQSIRVYGYGEETCRDGNRVFAPMQTDFAFELAYDADVPDTDIIATIESILFILTEAPPGKTPGPNPGRASFRIMQSDTTRQLDVYLSAVYSYLSEDNSEPLAAVLGLQDQLAELSS